MNTLIWKCKNGAKIPICEMTDSHLNNTIKLLERNYITECLKNAFMAEDYAADAPDGAAMAAESEANYLMEEAINLEDIAYVYPIYEDLIKEQNRREKQHSEILDDCVVGGCDRYGSLQN